MTARFAEARSRARRNGPRVRARMAVAAVTERVRRRATTAGLYLANVVTADAGSYRALELAREIVAGLGR